MITARTDLFDLAKQRLDWAARRQSVLAQNIANAATPGYLPKDIPPFTQFLAQGGNTPTLVQTSPQDLPGAPPDLLLSAQATRPEARTADGNGVALDQQLTKVADTQTSQNLVTSIYRKYLTMFGLALGKSA